MVLLVVLSHGAHAIVVQMEGLLDKGVPISGASWSCPVVAPGDIVAPFRSRVIFFVVVDFQKKKKESSSTAFRSRDLRVMGPARYTSCAMLLQERPALVLFVSTRSAELVILCLVIDWCRPESHIALCSRPRWLHQRLL